MAKTWYPVVDYVICSECGTCVTKCPHGVYDTRKAPSPLVRKYHSPRLSKTNGEYRWNKKE